MTDLRACAERVLKLIHDEMEPDQIDMADVDCLARAVLSSLDVPDREQLLRIVEHLEGDIRRGKPGMEFYAPLAAHTRRALLEST